MNKTMIRTQEEDYIIIESSKNGFPLIGQINNEYKNFNDKSKYSTLVCLKLNLSKKETTDNGLPNAPEVFNRYYDSKDTLLKNIEKLMKTYFVSHFFCNSSLSVYIYINQKDLIQDYLNKLAYSSINQEHKFSFEIIEDPKWEKLDFLFNKEVNNPELKSQLDSNKKLWELWKEKGIKDNETVFTVIFHFYATKENQMNSLCNILKNNLLEFDIKKTRTLFFLKGWKVDVRINKTWNLSELNKKTIDLFELSEQTGTLIEGLGAII